MIAAPPPTSKIIKCTVSFMLAATCLTQAEPTVPDPATMKEIRARTIERTDYLFIESGGFGPRNQPGWKSPWLVLQRKQAIAMKEPS